MSNHGMEAQRISYIPSHSRIFSAPPPSITNASKQENFRKGKEQCVLTSQHRPHRPTSLHILPSDVPSTCENKPQTLERSIDIPCKFQRNCNTATGKIYLPCPSASPRPISKWISKIACCTSPMVLREVLLPTTALAMIKTHSAYESTRNSDDAFRTPSNIYPGARQPTTLKTWTSDDCVINVHLTKYAVLRMQPYHKQAQ